MERKSIFQMAVMGGFLVLLFIGMLAFSGKIKLPQAETEINYGTVTLWGTLPYARVQSVIDEKFRNEHSVGIRYVEKRESTFNQDFIEALASGKGPDLVILEQDQVVRNLDKIVALPYTVFSERAFKDIFVEEAEMFMTPSGIIAVPLTIDPMVMYWNRDIFSNASIPTVPKQWGEFYDITPKIVTRDRSGNLTRSAVAFGEYRNISHAKDIVSLLMLQAGADIVRYQNGLYFSAITQGVTLKTGEAVGSAINFFSQFSKPDRDSYSWSRSLPASRTMFESGDLAIYFGYASEGPGIKLRNPHLNFDIATVPQPEKADKRKTFGRVAGVSILKASQNQGGAFRAAYLLSSSEVVGELARQLSLPPVRRDLLAKRPTDAVGAVLYDSALISKAWLDPSPAETDEVFGTMIDDIISGRSKISQALGTAQNALQKILSMLTS